MNKTLENIKNIFWIGDLSLQDADILAKYSKKSTSVLEFGVGGSTQIIAQCTSHDFISVETDPKWISITKSHIDKIINNPSKVTFCSYEEADAIIVNKTFDLVFVDGIDNLREDFAAKTWPLLSENGVMIFHDTRRIDDFKNVTHIAETNFLEVKIIEVNALASDDNSSNMTIIHKKKYEPYVNWNHTENKPLTAYGHGQYT